MSRGGLRQRDPVRQIADAVLYEGYILWPYRRSAMKNQRRWTFGGVHPRGHSRRHDDDPWTMQTQCLLETGDTTAIDVTVRFLQVVDRAIEAETRAGPRSVDELVVAGERHLAWEEARECEIAASDLDPAELAAPLRLPIQIAAGEEREALREADGSRVGAVVRGWQGLSGWVEIGAQPARPGLLRLTVRVGNETTPAGDTREEALKRTLCSTHAILRATDGAFVSMTDPPEGLRGVVSTCVNQGTWPVLVGEPESRDVMLSSPIILEDHPRIAPESPGDLFDGSEIDQLLVLNILSLTDEEKAEMRESDPRAREILERTEALSEDELMRLHGAIREFGMARER
jgi:hypothetical protein